MLITHCLVFNNWRVMHGRTAFKGTRRICGAYSKFRHLDGRAQFEVAVF